MLYYSGEILTTLFTTGEVWAEVEISHYYDMYIHIFIYLYIYMLIWCFNIIKAKRVIIYDRFDTLPVFENIARLK